MITLIALSRLIEMKDKPPNQKRKITQRENKWQTQNQRKGVPANKVIRRICATRVLKNAKVIRKAARTSFRPRTARRLPQLVLIGILKRFHGMWEADLRGYLSSWRLKEACLLHR